MKRILGLLLLVVFLLLTCSSAFADENGTQTGPGSGELDTLYWGAKVDMANTSATWPGYILRATFHTATAFKFGVEYSTVSKNFLDGTPSGASAWNGAIRDFKFHVKYAPWRTETYDFGVGLLYDSKNMNVLQQLTPGSYEAASNSATGLGFGVDGRVKASDKVSFYGLFDYVPSLKVTFAGSDKKFTNTALEVGAGIRSNESLDFKVGYRTESFGGDLDYKMNGLVLGVGLRY